MCNKLKLHYKNVQMCQKIYICHEEKLKVRITLIKADVNLVKKDIIRFFLYNL